MTDYGREPHLHVFTDRAMWRWSYHRPAREDGQALQLQSSIAFADAEEARSSAATAYPGVPFAEQGGPTDDAGPDEQSPTKHRCGRAVRASLVAAVLLATAVIILQQRSAVDHRGRNRPGGRPRFRPQLGRRLRLEVRLGRRGWRQ